MSHWTKLDHWTFLVAFILALINLFVNSREVGVGIFAFLLIAFLYDLHEQKSS